MEQKEGNHLKAWVGKADSDKWSKRRVGIGVNAPCTCFCRFCERNQELGADLEIIDLPREELIERLGEMVDGKEEQAEFVITGGIVGEPLLKGVDYLVEVVGNISSEFPQAEVRLNTTGNIFGYAQSLDVIRQFKDAGLDSMAISLNACTEEDYNDLCRPLAKKGGSFSKALDFIRASLEVLGPEKTYVSFVNYNDHPEAPSEWPRFSRKETSELLIPMGVTEDNIVFRDYIPLHRTKEG